MPVLSDYLNPSPSTLESNWRDLKARPWAAPGKRQVTFTPVETLLCLAAALHVNHRSFGGTTADDAPEPVPSLAALFRRPASSVLAKMANLDGSRANGGRFDDAVGQVRDDLPRLGRIYRSVLRAARAEGIDADALPDFLGVERGGDPIDRLA